MSDINLNINTVDTFGSFYPTVIIDRVRLNYPLTDFGWHAVSGDTEVEVTYSIYFTLEDELSQGSTTDMATLISDYFDSQDLFVHIVSSPSNILNGLLEKHQLNVDDIFSAAMGDSRTYDSSGLAGENSPYLMEKEELKSYNFLAAGMGLSWSGLDDDSKNGFKTILPLMRMKALGLEEATSMAYGGTAPAETGESGLIFGKHTYTTGTGESYKAGTGYGTTTVRDLIGNYADGASSVGYWSSAAILAIRWADHPENIVKYLDELANLNIIDPARLLINEEFLESDGTLPAQATATEIISGTYRLAPGIGSWLYEKFEAAWGAGSAKDCLRPTVHSVQLKDLSGDWAEQNVFDEKGKKIYAATNKKVTFRISEDHFDLSSDIVTEDDVRHWAGTSHEGAFSEWVGKYFIIGFVGNQGVAFEGVFETNTVRNKDINNSQFGDVTYERVLSYGKAPPQEETIYRTEDGTLYHDTPIQTFDARYWKPTIVTHDSIVKRINDILDIYGKDADKDDDLNSSLNNISNALQLHGQAPDILVKLRSLAQTYAHKTPNSASGRLYQDYKAAIYSLNRDAMLMPQLGKQLVRNTKVIDRRELPLPSSYIAPTPAAAGLSADGDNFIPRQWMTLTRCTQNVTPSPGVLGDLAETLLEETNAGGDFYTARMLATTTDGSTLVGGMSGITDVGTSETDIMSDLIMMEGWTAHGEDDEFLSWHSGHTTIDSMGSLLGFAETGLMPLLGARLLMAEGYGESTAEAMAASFGEDYTGAGEWQIFRNIASGMYDAGAKNEFSSFGASVYGDPATPDGYDGIDAYLGDTVVKNEGWFFFDWEKSMRAHSQISKVINLQRLQKFFNVRVPYEYFRVQNAQLSRTEATFKTQNSVWEQFGDPTLGRDFTSATTTDGGGHYLNWVYVTREIWGAGMPGYDWVDTASGAGTAMTEGWDASGLTFTDPTMESPGSTSDIMGFDDELKGGSINFSTPEGKAFFEEYLGSNETFRQFLMTSDNPMVAAHDPEDFKTITIFAKLQEEKKYPSIHWNKYYYDEDLSYGHPYVYARGAEESAGLENDGTLYDVIYYSWTAGLWKLDSRTFTRYWAHWFKQLFIGTLPGTTSEAFTGTSYEGVHGYAPTMFGGGWGYSFGTRDGASMIFPIRDTTGVYEVDFGQNSDAAYIDKIADHFETDRQINFMKEKYLQRASQVKLIPRWLSDGSISTPGGAPRTASELVDYLNAFTAGEPGESVDIHSPPIVEEWMRAMASLSDRSGLDIFSQADSTSMNRFYSYLKVKNFEVASPFPGDTLQAFGGNFYGNQTHDDAFGFVGTSYFLSEQPTSEAFLYGVLGSHGTDTAERAGGALAMKSEWSIYGDGAQARTHYRDYGLLSETGTTDGTDLDGTAAFPSSFDGVMSYADWSKSALNEPGLVRGGYRLMAFQYRDYMDDDVAYYNTIGTDYGRRTDHWTHYNVSVTVKDESLKVLDTIHDILRLEYELFITDYYNLAHATCSYNNLEDRFNTFFNVGMKERFTEPTSKAWIRAPYVYNISRELFFGSFSSSTATELYGPGRNVQQRITDDTLKIISEIGPEEGTMQNMEEFKLDFERILNLIKPRLRESGATYHPVLQRAEEVASGIVGYSLEEAYDGGYDNPELYEAILATASTLTYTNSYPITEQIYGNLWLSAYWDEQYTLAGEGVPVFAGTTGHFKAWDKPFEEPE